jgi:hypothetical protein
LVRPELCSFAQNAGSISGRPVPGFVVTFAIDAASNLPKPLDFRIFAYFRTVTSAEIKKPERPKNYAIANRESLWKNWPEAITG